MLYTQIKRDLEMAAEIQLSMLPGNFPLYPDRAEFDVYASMAPARDVGGDFYDAFLVGSDHLFFVIGDVSGKGVAAALFMVRAMTLFRTEAAHLLSPHEILHRVNGQLAQSNDKCMFVTVVCGMLDVSTGKLLYSNAGHGAPLIGSEGKFRYIDLPNGTAVGLSEDSCYSSMEVSLARGEMLFLYTDGVTEAVDGRDRQFSEDRLLSELNVAGSANPRHSIGHIGKSIEEFTRGVDQFDDITMLAISYRSGDRVVLSWSDDWNLGFFELDRQHQYLLDLLNQMDDLVQSQPAPFLPRELLDEFRVCSEQHIAAEERRFDGLTAKERKDHEEFHHRFEASLDGLISELANSRQRDIAMKTVFDLREIWLQHIRNQDAGLKRRGV
jgi:hemerythrin-like metal-binding protein